MLSDYIVTAVGLALAFWGIPALFIGMALVKRTRTGWNAEVQWESIRCPVKNKDVNVGFLEKKDSLRNLKVIDAVYCTALDNPTIVTCGKECLAAHA